MSRAADSRVAAAAPYLVLAVALFAVSHAAIFARLADAAPLAIAAWRLTFASLAVVPVAWLAAPPAAGGARPALAAGAGVLLAAHFGFWITSLAFTSIVRSVLLVSTAPIWVALIRFLLGQGAPSGSAMAALALAMAGVAVAGFDGGGSGSWTGDGLAILGAIAMAGYLLIARRVQQSMAFLPYIAVAYGSAAAVLWAAVIATRTEASGFTAQTWWALGAMALVSQLIGHSGYNWALRRLSPLFVAIALVGEPVLAALLGWWLLGEEVGWRTAAGGALILAGILNAARGALREH